MIELRTMAKVMNMSNHFHVASHTKTFLSALSSFKQNRLVFEYILFLPCVSKMPELISSLLASRIC